MNIVLALAGATAAAALILEYGGFEDLREKYHHLLHVVEVSVVAIFILDRFIRLVVAERRLHYLRENWIDFALIAVFLAIIIIIAKLRGNILSAGTLYVAITQIYILVTLILHGLSANLHLADSGIHPTWMLIGSFATMCLIGSGLLMLPAARGNDSPILYYPDALFTAVSATCVTGLIVRDTTTQFSPFGQGVILLMIQLGGLGIMLFGTVLALWVGKGLSMRGSNAIGQMVGSEALGELSRTIKFVVIATIGIELIGAACLFPMFSGSLDTEGTPLSPGGAVWHSVFHSISSFCNAGFALYGNNMMHGVREGWSNPLRNSWQIMGVIAPLIILGGLGFPVLKDSAGYLRKALRRLVKPFYLTRSADTSQPQPRLSLHSKIVLTTSASLIILGAVVLLAIEPSANTTLDRHHDTISEISPQNDWSSMSGLRRSREALFQSITARTAGFNTIDAGELSDAGKLWMCGLMTIGGSPASTAGGMKTVTVAMLVLAAYCVLRRRNELEAFQRSISLVILRRTVTLAILYMMLLITITLLLCVAMRGYQFIDLFFEASSACGTVGLTTGITRNLTPMGKYVIVAGMFIGRLGPLTLLLALTTRIRHVKYAYPTENIIIG